MATATLDNLQFETIRRDFIKIIEDIKKRYGDKFTEIDNIIYDELIKRVNESKNIQELAEKIQDLQIRVLNYLQQDELSNIQKEAGELLEIEEQNSEVEFEKQADETLGTQGIQYNLPYLQSTRRERLGAFDFSDLSERGVGRGFPYQQDMQRGQTSFFRSSDPLKQRAELSIPRFQNPQLDALINQYYSQQAARPDISSDEMRIESPFSYPTRYRPFFSTELPYRNIFQYSTNYPTLPPRDVRWEPSPYWIARSIKFSEPRPVRGFLSILAQNIMEEIAPFGVGPILASSVGFVSPQNVPSAKGAVGRRKSQVIVPIREVLEELKKIGLDELSTEQANAIADWDSGGITDEQLKKIIGEKNFDIVEKNLAQAKTDVAARKYVEEIKKGLGGKGGEVASETVEKASEKAFSEATERTGKEIIKEPGESLVKNKGFFGRIAEGAKGWGRKTKDIAGKVIGKGKSFLGKLKHPMIWGLLIGGSVITDLAREYRSRPQLISPDFRVAFLGKIIDVGKIEQEVMNKELSKYWFRWGDIGPFIAGGYPYELIPFETDEKFAVQLVNIAEGYLTDLFKSVLNKRKIPSIYSSEVVNSIINKLLSDVKKKLDAQFLSGRSILDEESQQVIKTDPWSRAVRENYYNRVASDTQNDIFRIRDRLNTLIQAAEKNEVYNRALQNFFYDVFARGNLDKSKQEILDLFIRFLTAKVSGNETVDFLNVLLKKYVPEEELELYRTQ
ncbi:MAG: hypothetical protein ABIK73_07160 [candidate division WOR-3 bacterium]